MDQAFLDDLKSSLQTAIANKVTELELPIAFYSNGTAGLTVNISIGEMTVDAGGFRERIGEKMAEFSPIAAAVRQPDGSAKYYGYYVAVDPEIALKLLLRGYYPDPKRGGRIMADVMLSQDYYEAVTPKEDLLRIERERLISSANELEAYMARNSDLEAKNAQLQEQLAALTPKGAAIKGKAAEAAPA